MDRLYVIIEEGCTGIDEAVNRVIAKHTPPKIFSLPPRVEIINGQKTYHYSGYYYFNNGKKVVVNET